MNIVYNDQGLVIKYIQLVLKEQLDTTLKITSIYDRPTHVAVKKYLARIDPRIKYLYTDIEVEGKMIQLHEDGLSYLLDFVIHPARLPANSVGESISTENYNLSDGAAEGSVFRSEVSKSIINDKDLWKIVPKDITQVVQAKVYYYYLDKNARSIFIDSKQQLSVGVDPANWSDSRYNYQDTIDNKVLFTYVTNDHLFVSHKFWIKSEYPQYDLYVIQASDSTGSVFYTKEIQLPKGISLRVNEAYSKVGTRLNKEQGYWYEELSDEDINSKVIDLELIDHIDDNGDVHLINGQIIPASELNTSSEGYSKDTHHKRYWCRDTGYPQSDIEDVDHAQRLLVSVYASGDDIAQSIYYPELFTSQLSTPEAIASGHSSMTEDIYRFLSLIGVQTEYQLGVIDPRTEEQIRKYVEANYIIK